MIRTAQSSDVHYREAAASNSALPKRLLSHRRASRPPRTGTIASVTPLLVVGAVLALTGCGASNSTNEDRGAVELPTGVGYIGCFTDKPQRALPVQLSSRGETAASCRALAASAGYAYAGTQWYGECFAGNEVGYEEVSNDECNTPCSANPSEMCGGGWRNSIYESGDTSDDGEGGDADGDDGDDGRPVSDIRDFGACNGGDDTDAVQSAIDALEAGGTLEVSCMANISWMVTLSGNDLAIRGTNGGGLRAISDMPKDAFSSILYVPNCTDCKVEGMKIDANNHYAELFLNHSTRTIIKGNTVSDIACDQTGAPYAAIHSIGGTDNQYVYNTVSRTAGTEGANGVRGIWLGNSDWETRPVIEHNDVSLTGHTGIATEGNGAVIRYNTVTDPSVQGTGLKLIHRGDANPEYVEYNTVSGTVGGGLMLESCDSPGIYVRYNHFDRIGRDGTTFGALYVAGSTTRNVQFTDNTITNAKNIANLNNADTFLFQDNAFNAGAAVVLETNNHNITLINSGDVEIQNGASDVWVDGNKVQ
jgi:hypothetical protein